MSVFTFHYRDLRQQRLERAIAALVAPVNEALLAQLTAEHTALAQSDWRASDRAFLAYAEDWLWANAPTLAGDVRADSALQALGEAAAITAAQLAAVTTLPPLPRPSGARPADFLEQVRAALGGDEAAFTELVYTAQRILSPTTYPFDDVGVVLPVRLETLFDPPNTPENPDPTRWKLLLRVVPDEASICRDNALVSDGERAALVMFWNAAAPKPLTQPFVTHPWLDSDDGQVAWANFCAKTTPARAAWLAASFQPVWNATADGLDVIVPPERQSQTPQPNRVGGLPPRLGVWVRTATAPNQRHAIGSLPMDPKHDIDLASLTLPLPNTLAGEDDARKRWWASWEAAQSVGLGGEWLLSADVTPTTIESLYVVGIGDESPDAHFRAQADAGELGTLPLGMPTNSVHGTPAAPLALDAETWRTVAQARILERTTPPSTRLGHFLVGDQAAIPAWPGATLADETQISQGLVQALWPALWGNWLGAIWRLGDVANRVAGWALAHLLPEGPLVPLRIADQPYGVLPVTALSQWQVGDEVVLVQQRTVEQRMAQALADLRRQWASVARASGTVVGKDASGFIDVLGRDAVSLRYITRTMVDPIAGVLAYGLTGAQRVDFLQRAAQAYQAATAVMPQPPLAYFLALGHALTRQMPLVLPWRMTYRAPPSGDDPQRVPLVQLLELLLTGTPLETLFEGLDHEDRRWHVLPNSLLVRLAIYACQLAAAWKALPPSQPAADMLAVQEKAALNIARAWFDRPEWWQTGKHPRTGQPRFLLTMPDADRLRLERAFRATLDTATHRIDPWITGFAWQRLKQHAASPRHAYRLGAYGWVDGPILGQPGPNDAGRLHAPSHGQALASLVLRDKYLSSQRELPSPANRNPWHMDIDSRRARLAQDLADEVRLGFNIHEILGRRVEHIMGVHQTVKALRTSARYAMHPQRNDPNEVCDGELALRGLLSGDAQFPLNADQRSQLEALQRALDTYGDLLLADGVMQLTRRQAERAAETMDAAAGFSRPPTFEFIRTPPSGYLLETRVLTVLPYVSVQTVQLADGPVRMAEPSLVTFIQSRLSEPWSWQVVDDAGARHTVSLADLGLRVTDTLVLSEELLADAARTKVGLEAGAGAVTAPAQQRLARQLCTVLGSRAAAGRDLADDAVSHTLQDSAIYAELQTRYQTLYQACTSTLALFPASVDDNGYAAAIRAALRWGITPVAEPHDKRALLAVLAGVPPTQDATSLQDLADRARKALQARLDAAPAPQTLPATIDGLASAIAGLATGDGKLTILARLDRASLTAQTGLKTQAIETTLDTAWLTTMAAVRPPLARLEALQLEAQVLNAFAPLDAWSNSPGDPWQTQTVAANVAARASTTPLEIAHPKFVVAYGSAEAWQAADVAVALLDSFSEAVPMSQRTTTVAFGFNAPASRAPQAILLAVPPAPHQRLDEALLLQTVIETRELAHARAARLEDLGELQALAPAMGLHTSGSPRVHLERMPLYE